ncbi:MAG: ABC transporter ATP-binding protein, partial [Eubacteriales bacterium]
YGMVLQETWLRNGTVRENIALGKPDASDDEIIEAAKKAHADDFIRKLSDGYNTVIGDNSSSISQGQAQLICIARVILQNPKILILDEATSSIDTRAEMKISAAMDEMMRGKTSFIVAHRLSTIQNADMILVMNEGKIVESGTHKELLQKGGFYSEIYMSQFAV